MNRLTKTVIKENFCIGCGICCAMEGSPLSMKFNKNGMLQAYNITEKKDQGNLQNICPMGSMRNEDDIAKEVFNVKSLNYQQDIGYYSTAMAGYLMNEEERISSSSGGMVTWFIKELFSKNCIDGVIHVIKSKSKDRLFEYGISYSVTEIEQGKKSRYYPVELSGALKEIKNDGKRYALVGVPCYIKGVRLLIENDSGFNNIQYLIGIICGQQKSKNFANSFAVQYGIRPQNLTDIDFRVKRKNSIANEYGMRLSYLEDSQSKSLYTKQANQLYGSDWGTGMFKYQACDVCDDVFNETADIVFGDAWVEPYIYDWKGTNLVIIRNKEFEHFFKNNDQIVIESLSETDVLKTQDASVRHRRKYIAYRLFLFRKKHNWIPSKRFDPSPVIDIKNKKIQLTRLLISRNSRVLKSNNSLYFTLRLFQIAMKPVFLYYYSLRMGVSAFIPRIIKRLFQSI